MMRFDDDEYPVFVEVWLYFLVVHHGPRQLAFIIMHLVDCCGVLFTNQQFIFWKKSQLLGMSGVFHDATTENKGENSARKPRESTITDGFLLHA
jgi:hypothetical protein